MPEIAFGPYTLLRRLAVGGMAEVYLARMNGPRGFEKQLVIKQILPQLAEDKELRQLFLDEATIASRLTHPGIVQITDVGEHEGTLYLAMEYVDGLDLYELLRLSRAEDGKSTLPVGIATRIVIDVAHAVHFAHEATDADGRPLDIVHRDVTPQNVLLSKQGAVKLGDFGIARARIRAIRTATGVLRGKLAYVSPEQFGGVRADRRADVYALGVVLFEALAGRRPFAGEDAGFIKEVINREAPKLGAFVPGIDKRLELLVARSLARRPGSRIATAARLASELETLRIAATQEELGEYVTAIVSARDEARAVRASSNGASAEVSSPPKPATETLPGRLDDQLAVQVRVRADSIEPTAIDPASRDEAPTGLGQLPALAASAPTEVGKVPVPAPQLPVTVTAFTPVANELPSGASVVREDPANLRPPIDEGPDDEQSWARVKSLLGRMGPRWLGRRGWALVLMVVCLGLGFGWCVSVTISTDPPRAEAPLASAGEFPEHVEARLKAQARARDPVPAPPAAAAPDAGVVEAAKPEIVELRPVTALEPVPIAIDTPIEPREPKRPRPRPIARPAAKKKPEAPPPPPPAVASVPAEAGYGDLSIDTEPWSNVTIGGRPLGPTPLAHVKLRAGKHRVSLVNPEQAMTREVSITVRADQRLAIKVRLADGRLVQQ